MYLYADFAIGHASKRNNIQNIKDFKLNGVIKDCYRSIFLFDEGLKEYVNRTKSITGYAGKHIADSLVFDFDGESLDAVREEAFKLCNYLYHEFEVPFDYLRISFSGSKGIHIAIPMQAKLKFRSKAEITKMNIIVAGTLGIVAGENPRLIKEKLGSFLSPNDREKEDDGSGGEE